MATAKRPSASRATRRTPATSDGAPKAAAPADPSFSFHWRISYRTVDAGWHTQRQMTDAIIDALATTQVWHHLPRLGGGADHTKPRGTPAATKKVIASGASRFVFTSDAPDIDMWGEGATAYLELEYGRRALHVTCALKQPLIGELGAKALDDLFTFARAYYDLIERKAYVTAGKAWTTWDRNDPLPKRQATWELRALADVLEPSRPADDERDGMWIDAQAIAKAKSPGVSRESHGDLLMLRWIDDPSDPAAANRATSAHQKWLLGILKTTPS